MKQGVHETFIHIITSPSASIELIEVAIQGLIELTPYQFHIGGNLFSLNLAERFMHLMDLTDKIDTEPHKSCHFQVVKILNICCQPPLLYEIGKIPILRKMLEYIDRPLDSRDPRLLNFAFNMMDTATADGCADFVPFLREKFAIVKKIISFFDVAFLTAAACRFVGNLMNDNDELPLLILSETDYLDKLTSIIRNSQDKQLVCGVCFDVSNITGGTVMKHIEMIVYHDIFSELIALAKSGRKKTRREAGWAVANTAKHPGVPFIEKLMELGVVELLCELMAAQELGMGLLCLQALFLLVTNIEGAVDGETIIYNPVAIRIGDCGGIETLKQGFETCESEMNRAFYKELIHTHLGPKYEEYLARRRGFKLKRAHN